MGDAAFGGNHLSLRRSITVRERAGWSRPKEVNSLIGQSTIGFFQLLVLTTVLACGGAAQDVPHDELAAAGPMKEADLKSRTESVLSDIDVLSRSLTGDTTEASVRRLHRLRTSIDDMGASAAPTIAPQTTPKTTKAQQSAPPSKAVKPSGEPPTEDEIAAMERAVELTHRPGPPLKDVEEAGDDEPLSLRVRRATADALVFLDRAEAAIREDDLDAARAALARAEQAIDELHASMR